MGHLNPPAATIAEYENLLGSFCNQEYLSDAYGGIECAALVCEYMFTERAYRALRAAERFGGHRAVLEIIQVPGWLARNSTRL